MTRQTPYYITTAIPFVNAAPHLGHALEVVVTDAIARHRRLRGRDVHFVSGTDENSLKNVRAAEEAKLHVRELVRRHSDRFRELQRALGVELDDFVRTSADPRHRLAVEALWNRCQAKGDLYQAPYRGLYCVGCERFVDAELEGRVCPEHRAPLEVVEEVNWFFRLGRYRDRLLAALEDGTLEVLPAAHHRESERFLTGQVRDICVSRSSERARGWGIPVPGDPEQVIYVWFDALANYLAALDYGGDEIAYHRYWVEAERVHVIGKGITRFHTVFWPAFLLSAGVPLPSKVLVHGYVTVQGEKISKTGFSVDPIPIAAEFGKDALRYYLLRHIRTTRDGDFHPDRLLDAYNGELANQLGNLVSRTLALVEREEGGLVPEPSRLLPLDQDLRRRVEALPSVLDEAIELFEVDRAVAAIFEVVAATNRYVDQTAPWALAKEGARERLRTVLHCCLQVLGALAVELSPFLPDAASVIGDALGGGGPWGSVCVGERVYRPPSLFPRISKTESNVADTR